MTREPVLSAAALVSTVGAILSLLVAFGLDLSDEQTESILVLVGIVAPIVAGLIARGKVTPTVDPRDDRGIPLVAEPIDD